MTFKTPLIIGLLCAATAAMAHEGVKNPAVMARMMGMKAIGEDTKVLGQMAKGSVAFDQAKLQAAATSLKEEAERIEALFKAREDDPKSEALPAIWDSYPDFAAKAQTLVTAASAAKTATTKAELQVALKDIGATCSACHKAYRQP